MILQILLRFVVVLAITYRSDVKCLLNGSIVSPSIGEHVVIDLHGKKHIY